MVITSLWLSMRAATRTKAGCMDVLCNALNLTHSVNFKLFPSNHLKIITTYITERQLLKAARIELENNGTINNPKDNVSENKLRIKDK